MATAEEGLHHLSAMVLPLRPPPSLPPLFPFSQSLLAISRFNPSLSLHLSSVSREYVLL